MFADVVRVMSLKYGTAGMLAGMALCEADEEIDHPGCQHTEPVAYGKRPGMEVRLDPGVVHDIDDTED